MAKMPKMAKMAMEFNEKSLQRSRLMMERTEHMARLASFEWDVDANVVTWSPEMFRIFGRDPALGIPNLEGQKELYTSQSTQMLFDAVRTAVADGTPYELELMTVQPDGEQRPCLVKGFPERDDSGRVVRLAGLVQDITERKRKEEKIRLAACVFSHAREGITITKADGTIIDINEAFTRITGYSREEAIGQNPRFLKSGRQDHAFYEVMWRDLLGPGHWSGEVWNRRQNGEVYAELLNISAVRDAHGITQQYVALFSDITGIKKHQHQLERIAHFDALTNLPNRVLLADRLQQAMVQAHRRGQQLAVAYLDLDGFKSINDHHGHGAGDHVLIVLAQRMKNALRECDTMARLGGDEFVAVLADLGDTAASLPMLDRLLSAAAQPIQWGERSLQVSASLGVTFYPQANDVGADQLLRQADQAMYQAKVAGRNRYQIFDTTMAAV
jgi:diguanylate cyclase (GGDEF)-like protein/PAS domain S-box-containing protein